ncbi:MAG: sigma-70 family RNA polymerase sigma factor [Planctomycetes bacterium]|nr:sigma-70 family RNA polymerase sigma factor [Planctomycetota bacterium]
MAIDHDVVVRLLLKDRAKLLAFIWSLLRDDHAAEDVYQEISILAIRKRAEIESAAHLLGWLRQAAKYKVIHLKRDAARHATVIDSDVLDLLEDQWSRFDGIEQYELDDALAHCLSGLTPRARQMYAMRYEQGMSGETVAERTKQTVASVYTALSRIHRAVADCMHRQVHGSEAPNV